MSSDQEQFEHAIAQNRYDHELRLVYSDWLEERGLDPELVRFHREWTPEWQRADDWLRALAADGRTSIDEIDTAARLYLKTGQGSMLGSDGLGFDVTNLFGGERTAEDFWSHWEVWSKTVVPADKRQYEPFTCCY